MDGSSDTYLKWIKCQMCRSRDLWNETDMNHVIEYNYFQYIGKTPKVYESLFWPDQRPNTTD